MLSNYSCRSPLGSSSVFWESGENSNLELLTINKPNVGKLRLTENFTADVAWRFSEISEKISTAVSLGKFIDQLLLKVISLQEKKYRPSDFLKEQREQILAWYIAVKTKQKNKTKMNSKHSQVLLVFRKNPRK